MEEGRLYSLSPKHVQSSIVETYELEQIMLTTPFRAKCLVPLIRHPGLRGVVTHGHFAFASKGDTTTAFCPRLIQEPSSNGRDSKEATGA